MTFNEVENGVMTYINKEFCMKLTDWRKWGLPLGVQLYMPTLRKMYEEKIDVLRESGIVCGDDIQIDSLYNQISKIAKDTGSIHCNFPIIGDVTFDSNDVNRLYYIMKQSCSSNVSSINTSNMVNNGINGMNQTNINSSFGAI